MNTDPQVLTIPLGHPIASTLKSSTPCTDGLVIDDAKIFNNKTQRMGGLLQ